MSDERLRELERRWKETGAVEDEAAFLLERVRAGELAQEQLELAAYCGHPAAQASTPGFEIPDQLSSWLLGLSRWGREVAVQAAECLSRASLDRWQDRLGDDDRPLEALNTLTASLTDGTPLTGIEAKMLAQSAATAGFGVGPPDRHAALAVSEALHVAAADTDSPDEIQEALTRLAVLTGAALAGLRERPYPELKEAVFRSEVCPGLLSLAQASLLRLKPLG